MQEIRQDVAAAHSAQLEEHTSEIVTQALQQGREQFRTQLRIALAVTFVLGILIAGGLVWYADQRQQRTVRLGNEYAQATACLNSGDYQCARKMFNAVLIEEPGYPGALSGLTNARYELASQFTQAGQWEQAVTELDAILRVEPADIRTLELLRMTYDRWYDDALARGDLLTALSVDGQRKARFPDATPTSTS